MSTTNGLMKSFKVTDKDGNVFIMTPVDTEARQAIDEAKNLQFDDDYFTSEVSQDNTTVSVGLNGVPLGIDGDSPLKFVQDTPQGIVLGSDAPFATAIAPEYNASSTYAVGDHCMHQGKYYECSTAISTAEAWNDAHWTEKSVEDEIGNLAVFHFTGTTYPNAFDIAEAVVEGKSVILIEDNYQRVYYLMNSTVYTAGILDSLVFCSVDNYEIKFLMNTNGDAWNTRNIAIGSVKRGGGLTDAASVNVPNNALSTLNTAQSTLTLNVNVVGNEVPNFAVEITPSVDVTLTVTKTVDNTVTSLNPSVAGGNSLTTGKLYQVTCVGSCWTLAEFTVPTP